MAVSVEPETRYGIFEMALVMVQSNPLKLLALGPAYEYPLRLSIYLSMFNTYNNNNHLTALCLELPR